MCLHQLLLSLSLLFKEINCNFQLIFWSQPLISSESKRGHLMHSWKIGWKCATTLFKSYFFIAITAINVFINGFFNVFAKQCVQSPDFKAITSRTCNNLHSSIFSAEKSNDTHLSHRVHVQFKRSTHWYGSANKIRRFHCQQYTILNIINLNNWTIFFSFEWANANKLHFYSLFNNDPAALGRSEQFFMTNCQNLLQSVEFTGKCWFYRFGVYGSYELAVYHSSLCRRKMVEEMMMKTIKIVRNSLLLFFWHKIFTFQFLC